MNLTNSQRVLRLVKSLVTQPKYALRYCMDNTIVRKSPVEMQQPWWSYGAIDAIKTLVHESTRIFEWGSGGSTLFLGQRAKSVHAVESDRVWYDHVKSVSAGCGLDNIRLDYVGFDTGNPSEFRDSDYLHALNDTYDIIVIDGIEVTGHERILCFMHAEKHTGAETIVLLDDFWRYETLLENNRAKEVKVFEGPGPGRIGVTSTALFFY